MGKSRRTRRTEPIGKKAGSPGLEYAGLLDGRPRGSVLVVCVYLVLTLVLFFDFVATEDMLFGSDTIPSGIFFRGLYRDFVREYTAMPLWDRFILGGLPFVDAMHGDTFYPITILQFLLPLHRALGYKLVIHVFLAGLGMFLFLRAFGLRQAAAAIGGLFYMFAPTLVSFVFAGHDAKMYVIALLPYQFYCLERGFQTRRFRYFATLGGVAGLSILSSHNQMAYFALWGVGLYFLFRLFILLRDLKTTQGSAGRYGEAVKLGCAFSVAMGLTLAVGALQLLPTYIYVNNYSVRGTAEKTSFEHATSFSLHPEEIASLVVPDFVGYVDKDDDTYWGRNPFKLNSEYAGIIPLIFAVLGLACREDRRKWFFLSGGILALAYALTYHTPLFGLCYEWLPGVQNFRAQGMIAFLYAFCACTLGAVGVDHVLNRENGLKTERDVRILRIVGAIILIGGVIGIVFTRSTIDLWIGLFYQEITPEKRTVLAAAYPGIRTGIVMATIIGLGTLSLAWARLRGLPGLWVVAGLAILVVIDTWRIDRGFIKIVDPDLQPGFRTSLLIAGIRDRMLKDGPFRVLDLSGLHAPNELGAHRIETVGGVNGFHDNETRWFRSFRGERDRNLLRGLSVREDEASVENTFLNLLNVRYILYRHGQDGDVQVVENSSMASRAFIAGGYEVVGSAERILERLVNRDADFRNTVLLEEDPDWREMPGGAGPAGRVDELKYQGNRVVLRASMSRRGVLVLSDNFLPYWKAEVNGKVVGVQRAYTTLRAVPLERGENRVVFTYDSWPYRVGKWITFLSIVMIILAVKFDWIREFLRLRDARHRSG